MAKVKNSSFSLRSLVLPALAFVLSMFIGGLFIALSDSNVLHKASHPLAFIKAAAASAGNAYLALFQGSVFDPGLAKPHQWYLTLGPLSETLVGAAPLILAGLSVALAFRAGLFNIGAQGQFIFGAIGASYVGFHFHLPIGIHLLLAALAGMVLGSLYGGMVGLLKARTGAHEVIVTIMLNYIALYFLEWLLGTTAFLMPGRNDPIAPPVANSARLPLLSGHNFRVNAGILVALAAAVFVWWLLNRSTLGFKFRAAGANTFAAKTAGISVPFVMTTAMAVAGALAGLAGAVHVLGDNFQLTSGVGGNFGFDAITVALLGRAKPLGTVFASLLFGALGAGAAAMQAKTNTPIDLVLIIQALVVLFIAAPDVVKSIFRIKNLKVAGGLVSKGWNG